MAIISKENQIKGQQAEAAFQAWLDKSNVPFLYIDQKIETYPAKLLARLKRPDFLVGVVGIGTLALDAKGYRLHDKQFSITQKEVSELGSYQRYFNQTVMYAFIPPEHRYELCWLISNDEFDRFGKTTRIKGQSFKTLPARMEDCYDMRTETFMEALGRQVQDDPHT